MEGLSGCICESSKEQCDEERSGNTTDKTVQIQCSVGVSVASNLSVSIIIFVSWTINVKNNTYILQ